MSRQDLGRMSNRGCNNGRWWLDTYEPEEPRLNDIWFDMNFMLLKYYDGSAWQPFFGTGLNVVRKTTDEGLASTTTVQDDNELFIESLESNSTYHIQAFIGAYGTNTADVKISWLLGGSAAAATSRHCNGPATSSTNNLDTNISRGLRSMAAGQPYGIESSIFASIKEDFIVVTTATTGSIQMRWAQNTSQAIRTTVTSDSFIVYRRLQ